MKPARSLEFDVAAFEDLSWWIEQDRLVRLISPGQRDQLNR